VPYIVVAADQAGLERKLQGTSHTDCSDVVVASRTTRTSECRQLPHENLQLRLYNVNDVPVDYRAVMKGSIDIPSELNGMR